MPDSLKRKSLPARIAEASLQYLGLGRFVGERDVKRRMRRLRECVRQNIQPEERAFVEFCDLHGNESTSQIFQDLFVLHRLGCKRSGFFVEFGATDGIQLSNTYLLEKKYGWKGILAEPAHIWHASLARNRACAIDQRCVWEKSGEELVFNQADSADLSTIESYGTADEHADRRKNGTRYSVPTISLIDLLKAHAAPRSIDYLSIDTEGSEFRILSAFDFDQYSFGIVTVEHNFMPEREKIRGLLESHGYVRLLDRISRWDDWYVKPGSAS